VRSSASSPAPRVARIDAYAVSMHVGDAQSRVGAAAVHVGLDELAATQPGSALTLTGGTDVDAFRLRKPLSEQGVNVHRQNGARPTTTAALVRDKFVEVQKSGRTPSTKAARERSCRRPEKVDVRGCMKG
jgi:hypothetical protein